MNIGLFGGTFDPVHRGHLALARAALEQYKLHRIHFVAGEHSAAQAAAAALAISCTALPCWRWRPPQEKAFVPSLLEAPGGGHGSPKVEKDRQEKPNYTIDTIRRLKQSFKASDKLFLLIGMDAFADIAKWHQAEALFRECEFVVASRPGYSLADVANALPESLRPRPEVTRPFHKQAATGDLVLKGATIHLLARSASAGVGDRDPPGCGGGQSRWDAFVDAPVAEYIRKMGLYRSNGAAEFRESVSHPV